MFVNFNIRCFMRILVIAKWYKVGKIYSDFLFMHLCLMIWGKCLKFMQHFVWSILITCSSIVAGIIVVSATWVMCTYHQWNLATYKHFDSFGYSCTHRTTSCGQILVCMKTSILVSNDKKCWHMHYYDIPWRILKYQCTFVAFLIV